MIHAHSADTYSAVVTENTRVLHQCTICVLYTYLVWFCVRGGVLDVTPLLSGGYYTVPLDSLGIPPVVVLHRVMGAIS